LALWVVTAISAVGTLVTGAVSLLRFKDHFGHRDRGHDLWGSRPPRFSR
jgi:hypothetical protein